MQCISCVKVASNFVFRLSIRYVGRMNTQVWLLNSLGHLVGWVTNSLVRCVTRNGWCSIQHTMLKCLQKRLAFCLFPLPARIAECSLPESHNAWKLQSLWELQNRRMFGNKNCFSCQSNLLFCVDEEKETLPKPYRGMPRASHGINLRKSRWL